MRKHLIIISEVTLRQVTKTINIRGLFRVPDVSGGERLMIDTEEKEEEKEQEQRLQIPMSSANDETWNRLPGLPNESLPNVSKAMMSYPSGKPEFPTNARFPFGNGLPNNWNNKI